MMLHSSSVTHVLLSDICKIEKGKQLNKELLFEEGTIPVINGGVNPSGYWSESNYPANSITISQGGASAGFVNWQSTDFWAGAHCYVITNPNQKINYRYLYHVIKNNEYDLMNSQIGAGIPSLSFNDLESIVVPLPSLDVQREIVRILDSFTALTAELTAELTARKKQYEFYRDKLLSFDNLTPEERVSRGFMTLTLGELFSFKNGLNKGKEFFGKGTPIVNFTDVYNKNRLFSSSLTGRVDVTPEEIERFNVAKGDVFFTRTSETKEDIGMASVITEDVKDCVFSGFVLRARPITSLLLPQYCSYCFSTKGFREEIVRYSSYTTRALTSGTTLSKLTITIPPLDEQKKIASILDKFESLCNDITLGLPAEIAARQKQYEYYRDKLLSFNQEVVRWGRSINPNRSMLF